MIPRFAAAALALSASAAVLTAPALVVMGAPIGGAPIGGGPVGRAPVVIATGPVSGFAFPLGGEICRLYEKAGQDRAQCAAEATEGSVEDINRLRNGEIPLAIVQSDMAADAISASGAFSGQPPFADLRSIAGFYGQVLTVLVRTDGPVRQVDDLKGKRVAVGLPGAPDPLFADFLGGLGWSKADLGGIVEMPRNEQIATLCNGGVAALVITAPHPNGFVREALAACRLTILDLAGAGVDGATEAHPAYAAARLDLGVYGAGLGAIQSFGPRAALVTTAKEDPGTVARLLTGILKQIDDLKAAHPAFAEIDKSAIAASAGLGADRHPAATKYLIDNKLIDPPAAE